MDNIKARLLQFAKNQKIGMMQFYKKISVPASNFSGKGGDSALSTDKIVQILTEFPLLNPDWLLLGKGEMLRENTPEREGNTPRYTDFFEMLHEKDRQIAEKDRQMSQLLTAICNLTNK